MADTKDKASFSIVVDRDLNDKLEDFAKKEERSKNFVINKILKGFFAKKEKWVSYE